jgi:phage protein D
MVGTKAQTGAGDYLTGIARHTDVRVIFAGVDITAEISPFITSIDYTDNEADETDDLQIKLQDRDGIWLHWWLNAAVQSASSGSGNVKGLIISAIIIRRNWHGDGQAAAIGTGAFELDNVKASGPPATITIKATSLPYGSATRQQLKTQGWEGYNLQGIASEIAGRAGMEVMYLSSNNPTYDRVEQFRTADIVFLTKLCHNAGISLKVMNNTIILFDQAEFECMPCIATISRGDGSYTKYNLSTGQADTQYSSCRVSYNNPQTGEYIESIAYADDAESSGENNQQLEITTRVTSIGEAQAIAEKQLRLHNKFERTATFTMLGNPYMVAGSTVMLFGFGMWDGPYIIKKSKHTVNGSGYTTTVELRDALAAN